MNRPRLHPSAYTIAWVSALPIESAAAVEMVDEEHYDPRGHVSNTDQYGFGRVGEHNVVMARLPSGQMGNNSAAAVVARLTAVFTSIRFALMVGIGGGVPSAVSDIRLGDVVVGHPHLQHGGVVQYDFGKTGLNGQIMRTGALNAPPREVLNAIAKLRENHHRHQSTLPTHLPAFDPLHEFSRSQAGPDFLFKAMYNHAGGESCGGCDVQMKIERGERDTEGVVIHYGTIASGNQVMKDGMTRDRISAELGGVLCFEMEAAGLSGAFSCLVIRGICDYADSHKNKSWQPYAAATAAAVAKELLLVIPADTAATVDTTRSMIDSKLYQVPFSLKGVPVGRFADRPRDMQRLEQVLLPQMQASDYRRKVTVLTGLGGIGKTQLAVEFARKHKADFSSVFWLDGSSKNSLKQSIAACTGRIPQGQISETSRKYSSSANGDLDIVIQDYMEWLNKPDNKHWLLIFDNVDRDYQLQGTDDDAYDINDYMPDADHGLVLITTRLTNLQQLGESLYLGSVVRSEAQAIFRKWYNQDFDLKDSDELLQLLDGLPLALAQAAAYMSESGTSFSTYTRLYKEQWNSIMESENATTLRSYGNRSINMTWTMSYNAVRAKDEAAANLLLLWAHLDNKTLPLWMIQTGANRCRILAKDLSVWLKDIADNEVQFWKICRLLRSYCLIESLHGSSTHSIHPVVHQWAFHIQTRHQQAELSRLALCIIGNAVPNDYAAENYVKQQQLFPHAQSWIEGIERATVHSKASFDEEVIYALHMIGMLLSARGSPAKAEKIYQRALEGYEKVWGPAHPSTFPTINNLGILYTEQGKLAEAEKMHRRALEGKEKALGPDHPSTLNTINNLGILYAEQGKLAEAERMYRRALEVKEKVMGPDHISTLDIVNNLGLLYANQGKLAEAEQMYRRALEGREALYPDHTSTLNSFNNLSHLYAEQGKLSEAEEMFRRTIERKEKALGPDHISTLNTINDLGILYSIQGKPVETKKMYRRALEGKEKTLGPDHPSTLNTINNLGILYAEQGKLAEAENMYWRALEGKEKTLGADNISTLNVVNSLGLLYADQGKLAEAEQMYQRALEGYENAVGPHNALTYVPALNSVYNYGILFERLGRVSNARSMYTRALKGYETVFGTGHRKYLDAYECLQNLEASLEVQSTSPMAISRLGRR